MPTQKSFSPALREWQQTRDWATFASTAVGDTAVKDSLKQLLASGVHPDTKDRLGRTALHLAAMLGQTELARYLLSNGAAVDARDRLGRTPLMISASLGGVKLFPSLPSPWFGFWAAPLCPERGLDALPSGTTEAVMNWYLTAPAHPPLVQLLMEAGADVNAADGDGRTVLDYAGVGGLTDIDRLILKSGRIRGQEPCEVKQAPTLRGFRMGMTLREVLARFPRYVAPSADACGRLNLTFKAADGTLRAYAQRLEEFQGVSRLSMTFHDERLAYLRVTYGYDTAGWRSMDEYLAALSGSLGLPPSWHRTGESVTADNAYMLGCDGFKVVAGYDDGLYVELHDTEALWPMLRRKVEVDARLRREAEEERERRRREFKP